MGDDGKPEKSRDPHRDLAGVLHDVSNALTVLLGWIGEARAPDATPETVAYALTIIDQRARIARDLARVAIGAARIDEQRAAGEIVAEVAQALRVEADKCGASIDLTGEDTASKLAGAVDVSQVVTNLVMNAIAYAPKGTAVEVAIADDGDRVQVTVTDHGPGVPVSRRDTIFEGESTRPGGTGVGLRHSRALARVWGGDVILLPPEAGKGASFCVSWPRADASAIPRPPTSSARVRGLSGVRVLLIEDDIAVTQLLETALEGRGAEVTVAATSAELATAIADADAPFDAALMDLSPIASDPAAAIASLRKGSPNIELILITGSADRLPDAVATEAMKLVRKPFELGEVLAVLGALTKKP